MQAVSAVRSNKKADRNSAAEVRDVDHEIGFGFVTAAAVAVDEEGNHGSRDHRHRRARNCELEHTVSYVASATARES